MSSPRVEPLVNLASELSILDDAGPVSRQRRRKRQSLPTNSTPGGPGAALDAKVLGVLETLRDNNLSLADFIHSTFSSRDARIRPYVNRFFDHAGGKKALRAVSHSKSKSARATIQPWIIDTATAILTRELKDLRKSLKSPMKSYTRQSVLNWSMAGTEKLFTSKTPHLFSLLSSLASSKLLVDAARPQTPQSTVHAVSHPTAPDVEPSTPPSRTRPSPAHPEASSSPLPPSSPLEILLDDDSSDSVEAMGPFAEMDDEDMWVDDDDDDEGVWGENDGEASGEDDDDDDGEEGYDGMDEEDSGEGSEGDADEHEQLDRSASANPGVPSYGEHFRDDHYFSSSPILFAGDIPAGSSSPVLAPPSPLPELSQSLAAAEPDSPLPSGLPATEPVSNEFAPLDPHPPTAESATPAASNAHRAQLKRRMTVVMTIGMLAIRGNQTSNALAGVIGAYCYARRTSPHVINFLAQVGASITDRSVHALVRSLRRDALELARMAAADPLFTFLVVHDNLQFRLTAAQITLSNHSSFLNTTTAYIARGWNVTPEMMACAADYRRQTGKNGVLTAEDVQISGEEASRMDTIMVYHVVSILVDLSGLSHFSSMRKELQPKLPEVHKIGLHKTEIYPLAAMALNESSTSGTRKVLETIFSQLGIDKQKACFRVLWAGNQLSSKNNRGVINMRKQDVSHQERFDHIEPFSGGFHMKMISATNIVKNHFGKPNVDAPESLWTHEKILHRKHTSLDNSPPYKPLLSLIQTSCFARILDCWKVLSGCRDLGAYAAKKPSFEAVWELGQKLVREYVSSRHIARRRKKSDEARDRVFENSCLFLRDALLLIEACAAVKVGDSGRLEAVRRFWTFCFWGAGSHNYGLECLLLEQNLRYEWTAGIVSAYMDNCLLNPKGRPNGWVEPDLVQEFLNFWIKVIYACQGTNASFDFIQHISPCIDVLRHIIQSVETEFSLPRRSGKHKAPELQRDLRLLSERLSEANVHRFTPGRTSNMPDVTDVFERGVQVVLDGKLAAFEMRMRGTAKFDGGEATSPMKPSDALDPDMAPTITPESITELMLPEFGDCGLADDDAGGDVPEEPIYLDFI